MMHHVAGDLNSPESLFVPKIINRLHHLKNKIIPNVSLFLVSHCINCIETRTYAFF